MLFTAIFRFLSAFITNDTGELFVCAVVKDLYDTLNADSVAVDLWITQAPKEVLDI